MVIDRAIFFNSIRPLFGTLKQSQVDGMNAILNGWERRAPDGDVRWLAYMFATAFHETNRTMQPVREAYWLSEQWRSRNLRYYPYYGRGYVQLTWRENYRRAGEFIGADLVRTPDLAMDAGNAAVIMFVGMEEGWFRSDARGRHTLRRYFSNTANDPVGAREIINGREVKVINGRSVLIASLIAQYHDAFKRAITFATVGVVREESIFLESVAEERFFSPPDDLVSLDLNSEGAAGPLSGEEPQGTSLMEYTVGIVTAFLDNNAISHKEVPGFLISVHQALAGLVAPPPGGISTNDWTEEFTGTATDDDAAAEMPASPRKRRRKVQNDEGRAVEQE
ncbi:glycoside hydrolase family 19 protein [Pseudochelatococcus sp. B33]